MLGALVGPPLRVFDARRRILRTGGGACATRFRPLRSETATPMAKTTTNRPIASRDVCSHTLRFPIGDQIAELTVDDDWRL